MEFLKKLPLSFFSPHLYNTEAREGKGNGWGFIFALTVFTALALTLELGSGGSAGFLAVLRGLPNIVRSLPAMTMKDGQLSIDGPVPYEIKLGDNGLRIVIDTSYKITGIGSLKEKLQDKKIILLLAKDAFIGQGNNGDLRIQSFKNMQDFSAGHEEWENVATWLEGWGIPLIISATIAVLVLFTFIYNTIATFLSAIVATILGSVMRAALDFDAAMRLAALARFPASLVSLLPFIRPGIGWLIWVAYLIFAVVACRQTPPSQKAV